ncbi:hypothetical protein B566_EDAN011262 [Ephemera danica]|nr:hypothetical protein B566_EDAN011262 [Ephemera danica]
MDDTCTILDDTCTASFNINFAFNLNGRRGLGEIQLYNYHKCILVAALTETTAEYHLQEKELLQLRAALLKSKKK